MLFTKYTSIENTYREGFLDKIRQNGYNFDTLQCEVREKIHGAQHSIYYNGVEIAYAKRTTFIGETEKFNCYASAASRDAIEGKVKALYDIVQPEFCIVVCGELFGGGYKHPDVDKGNEAKLQRGVEYAPVQHFAAFDIIVDGKFISMDRFDELTESVDMVVAPKLFTGTLTECLKYPNDGESTVYELYNLPKIEDNIMEGVVIKPIDPIFMGHDRLILKNKNDKFKERSRGPREKKTQHPITFSEEEQRLLDELITYLNANRIRSVISKLGTITTKQFGKLMGLTSQDCMEDFVKDYPEFKKQELVSRKKISNQFMKYHVAPMIRADFLNIIDGSF